MASVSLTAAAGATALADSPEDGGTEGTLVEVSPEDMLFNPMATSMSGTGFLIAQPLDVRLCAPDAGGPGVELCSDPITAPGSTPISSSDGSFVRQSLLIPHSFDPPGPAPVVDCLTAPRGCRLRVAGATNGRHAFHHLDFPDGRAKIAFYRPETGTWFFRDGATEPLGAPGDIPVLGEFFGFGIENPAVFRPSTGFWFMNDGSSTEWGTAGDVPVPGDYDGDNKTDLAVFRPSISVWFVRGGVTAHFGTTGDVPVPGDYDGDGDTDIAVFRPSTSVWFVLGGITAHFGTTGDIPVPGDYDGDGDTDIAVFRPSNGVWLVRGGPTVAWGTTGDVPVPGDYDGDGDTDIAVFRPSTGKWFVLNGPAVVWGTAGDIPGPLPHAVYDAYF